MDHCKKQNWNLINFNPGNFNAGWQLRQTDFSARWNAAIGAYYKHVIRKLNCREQIIILPGVIQWLINKISYYGPGILNSWKIARKIYG